MCLATHPLTISRQHIPERFSGGVVGHIWLHGDSMWSWVSEPPVSFTRISPPTRILVSIIYCSIPLSFVYYPPQSAFNIMLFSHPSVFCRRRRSVPFQSPSNRSYYESGAFSALHPQGIPPATCRRSYAGVGSDASTLRAGSVARQWRRCLFPRNPRRPLVTLRRIRIARRPSVGQFSIFDAPLYLCLNYLVGMLVRGSSSDNLNLYQRIEPLPFVQTPTCTPPAFTTN